MRKEFEIAFDNGIVDGCIMRDTLKIFPVLAEKFTRRKEFDEYYFDHYSKVSVSMQNIIDLSENYSFSISYDSIIVHI